MNSLLFGRRNWDVYLLVIFPILSKPRIVGKLNSAGEEAKSQEMFEQKASYGDIALVLGYRKERLFNYVRDYPYFK